MTHLFSDTAKVRRPLPVALLVASLATSSTGQAATTADYDTHSPSAQLEPSRYRHYDFSQQREAASTDYSIFDTSFDQSGGMISSTLAASTDDRLQPLARLETAWSGTAPLTSIAMRLGDAVSNPSTWSRAVRFGGVQIGSLQDLPADLVTAPELSAGHAALPSAADLMTHDLHRVTHINPGGNVTLAVDDVLGRRREIAKPLYTDIAIAPKGKTEYSLAAGRVRENFALTDGEYGARFTAATVRYGLRKSLTMDAHAAQVAGKVSVIGGGLAKDAGQRGKVSASMATSRSDDHHAVQLDKGWLARLGYQIATEYLDLALRARVQSPTYRDIGAEVAPLHRRALASVTLKLGGLGHLLLAGAVQTFHDARRADFVSVRHNLSLGEAGEIAASFAYNTGEDEHTAAQVSFTHSFGAAR